MQTPCCGGKYASELNCDQFLCDSSLHGSIVHLPSPFFEVDKFETFAAILVVCHSLRMCQKRKGTHGQGLCSRPVFEGEKRPFFLLFALQLDFTA